MRANWVIFCGLLRNKEVALEKLTTLKRWLQEGRIDGVVCCWWRRESDLNPDIVQLVLESGFRLVQLEEPKLRTAGHTIHQALTWWYALQAVPKYAFVLKTRPDLGGVGDELLDGIEDVDLDLSLPAGWPTLFQNKILIGNAFAISPYYMHDITFYGRREDLFRLANLDLSSEYMCASLAPEQMLFRGAMANRLPLLDSYLPIYPPLQFDAPERSQQVVETLLASDYYLDVFATYMHVIGHYFRLGFIADSNRTSPPLQDVALADLLNGRVEHPEVQYHAGACAVLFTGEAPVRAVLDGHVKHGDGGLARAVERTSSYDYICSVDANPLFPAPGLVDLQVALGQVMHHEDYKTDRKHDPDQRHFIIRGHHDRVQLTTQNDEVKALEAELSQMRRTIDSLRTGRAQ